MSNKRYHDPYFGLVKMHRRILFGWDVEVFDGGGGGIVGREASSSSVKSNGATCVVVIGVRIADTFRFSRLSVKRYKRGYFQFCEPIFFN